MQYEQVMYSDRNEGFFKCIYIGVGCVILKVRIVHLTMRDKAPLRLSNKGIKDIAAAHHTSVPLRISTRFFFMS